MTKNAIKQLDDEEEIDQTPKYKIEPVRKSTKRFQVSELIDGENPIVLAEIGCINAPPDEKKSINYPYWYISNNSEIRLPEETYHFPTKELAAEFIILVRKTYLAELKRNPLTKEARRYINNRARALRERTSKLMAEWYDLNQEKWELLILARQTGTKEAEYFIDDSDLGKAINNLLEFKIGEYPFFSEMCLYDLIGKDDARTILGMLERLISIVKPDKASDI